MPSKPTIRLSPGSIRPINCALVWVPVSEKLPVNPLSVAVTSNSAEPPVFSIVPVTYIAVGPSAGQLFESKTIACVLVALSPLVSVKDRAAKAGTGKNNRNKTAAKSRRPAKVNLFKINILTDRTRLLLHLVFNQDDPCGKG